MNEIRNPSTSTHFSIPTHGEEEKGKFWVPHGTTPNWGICMDENFAKYWYIAYQGIWKYRLGKISRKIAENRQYFPIYRWFGDISPIFPNFFRWSTQVNTCYNEGLNLLLRGLEPQTKGLNLLLKVLEPQTN